MRAGPRGRVSGLGVSAPIRPQVLRLHANETNTGFFYALNATHLFGQYGEAEFQLSSRVPFVESFDAGQSWQPAAQSTPSCSLSGAAWQSVCFQNALVPLTSGGFYSLQGNGPLWGGPSVSESAPPWTNFSSPWRAQYAATGAGGSLNMAVRNEGVVFGGIPEERAVWPLCSTGGLFERSIFTYAVVAHPSSDEVVAAVLLCDSPHTKQLWGTAAEPTNLSAPSLVAFASPADGSGNWSYRGVIMDARMMVPQDTVRGLTGEAALAVLADGKTLVAIVRTDGDCTCGMARVGPGQQPECGIYRYYYQAYSADGGRSWSKPRPIRGAGCVRPHLLSFGGLAGGGLVLSGGRICVENMTGLFIWHNPDGLADHAGIGDGSEWQRHSITYWHNRLWKGETAYKFDERVNVSNLFESQAYTGLIPLGKSEDGNGQDFMVTYNRYWDPLFDGMPGCDGTDGNGLGCSTGFGMQVTIDTISSEPTL